MALIMQGMTADNVAERKEMIDMLVATTAGTRFMHEGFSVNNPGSIVFPWFTQSLYRAFTLHSTSIFDKIVFWLYQRLHDCIALVET